MKNFSMLECDWQLKNINNSDWPLFSYSALTLLTFGPASTLFTLLTSHKWYFLKSSLIILGKHYLQLHFNSQINSCEWNGNCWAIWRVNTVSYIVFSHEPTLFVSCLVQRGSLKESSHKCKAVLFDVRLASKGVQHWIGTATGESKSRGDRTAGFRDEIQSAKTKPAFLVFNRCQNFQSWCSKMMEKNDFIWYEVIKTYD